MRGIRTQAAAALVFFCMASRLPAQDEGEKLDKSAPEKPAYVKLPPLEAYKIGPDTFYLIRGKVPAHQADFVRRLRLVPVAKSAGEPSSLIIDTYLKKPSKAFGTTEAYVESDWMDPDELALAAALVPRAAWAVDELFEVPERHPMKTVLRKTRDEYYELTDAWASEDRLKKMARSFSGIWVNGYRDAFENEIHRAYALVIGDTVRTHLPESFRAQVILTEALHVYVSCMMVGDLALYIASDTTPRARDRAKPEMLYEYSREFWARPKHEAFERVLKSELNAITFERLSVAFSIIDYLLQKPRSVWKTFVETLDRESKDETGKLKNSEARYPALSKALEAALGRDPKALEEDLGKFTAGHYLWTEELARQIGLDRECAESTFSGFETICRLKRDGKPVSEKGERIYTEILKRLERKLGAEKF